MPISFFLPPAALVISSHWAAVRWSFHKMAGRSGLVPSPDLSDPRNTDPCICPDRPIPVT